MRLRASSGEERDVETVKSALPAGVTGARDGKVAWVFHRGETYRIERSRGAAASHEEPEHDLRAPMPGRVTKLYVAEGTEVLRGTPLLVLEAMKMEHEVKAPRDGTVRKVLVAQGEMVDLGELLVEVD
jgi:biotin carboxyl carrier protein